MRIIVDTGLNTGSAEYQNLGDVAMLQVAVNRLRKLWPSASVEVLTESPDNLSTYCPGAKSLTRAGRNLWIGDSFLFGRFHQYFPKLISSGLNGLTKTLERKLPVFLRFIIRLRLRIRPYDYTDADLITFLEAMENADLFVVCGAGGFADGSQEWTLSTLDTLETAIRRGIPVVMFGQQIGPLNDLNALSKAKEILPEVTLITLRGTWGGLSLLEALGVDTSRVLTTGDEAIELAYEARPQELGQGLGINLRVAFYAEIEKDFVGKIRPILQEFARQHNAPMIPLPIAFHPLAADHLTIQQLLAGFDDQSDGGLTLDTPLKVIKQAGLCRIVVTGAYHAAVFALAQGIPVVCLAKSPYYVAKFLGLEDQFGPGCETVFLNDPDVFEKLSAAIERSWESAEIVRSSLQKAALRQIELSRNAYEQVRDLFNSQDQKDTLRGFKTCQKSAGA
jgi:colanic acid/amylovoran biosynthesis protein